jgi:hypothetical protein
MFFVSTQGSKREDHWPILNAVKINASMGIGSESMMVIIFQQIGRKVSVLSNLDDASTALGGR